MYIPDCEHCAHRGDCAMLKANQEMRETIWNINREASGRHDYILNGKHYPAEEGE